MEYVIFEILELIIEFLVIMLLFENIKTQDKKRMISWVILTCIMLILTVVFRLKENVAVVDLALSICLVALFLETQWYKKITIFVLVYSVSSLTYQGLGLMVDFINVNFTIFDVSNARVEIFEKFLVIIILFIILLFKEKKQYMLKLTQPTIIILGIESIIISTFLSALALKDYEVNKDLLYLLLLLSGTSILLVFFYLIVASSRNISSEKSEAQMRYIEGLKVYYKELEENEIIVRKIRHDMNNHFQILRNLAINREIDEIQKYLEQYQNGVNITKKKIPNLGSAIINAIIMQKICEYPNIDIEYKGALKEQYNLNEYDLCTILINVLDNALEYSNSHGFSKIKMGIYQDNNYIIISVENRIEKEIELEKLGEFTTKQDKKNHGYGISNVKEVVNKYGGSLEYFIEEDILRVRIKLYLN